MHSHAVKGSKLQRERDQRRALIKGLANSLIAEESIMTTLPKAKMTLVYTEKLITKAKKQDLHSRRQLVSKLGSVANANKLCDEIAPQLNGRNSGHLRIVKESPRRGDNAPMATVEFVDKIKASQSTDKKNTSSKPKASSKEKN